MASKDWFYISGIAVSVILGIFNLYFVKINRRNALREHLYKEQLNLCLKLPEKFCSLLDFLYDYRKVEKFDNSAMSQIEKNLNEFEILAEQAEIILPDELVTQLSKVEVLARKLKEKGFREQQTDEFNDQFLDAYMDLTDLIREHIGVDKLSHENKKMANR